MLQDSNSHPVDNVKPKRDIVEQVADMTLHQLSIALSQKKSRKSEARCVALLGFYSLSMNNMGSKSSVLLLSPKLSKKGKGRASVGTICFLLSIASTKYINGNKNGNQDWETLSQESLRYHFLKCAALFRIIAGISDIASVLAYLFKSQNSLIDGTKTENPPSPNSITVLSPEPGSDLGSDSRICEAPVARPVHLSPNVRAYNAWEHREDSFENYPRLFRDDSNTSDGTPFRGGNSDIMGRDRVEGNRGRERGSERGGREGNRYQNSREREGVSEGERERGRGGRECENDNRNDDRNENRNDNISFYSTIHYVEAEAIEGVLYTENEHQNDGNSSNNDGNSIRSDTISYPDIGRSNYDMNGRTYNTDDRTVLPSHVRRDSSTDGERNVQGDRGVSTDRESNRDPTPYTGTSRPALPIARILPDMSDEKTLEETTSSLPLPSTIPSSPLPQTLPSSTVALPSSPLPPLFSPFSTLRLVAQPGTLPSPLLPSLNTSPPVSLLPSLPSSLSPPAFPSSTLLTPPLPTHTSSLSSQIRENSNQNQRSLITENENTTEIQNEISVSTTQSHGNSSSTFLRILIVFLGFFLLLFSVFRVIITQPENRHFGRIFGNQISNQNFVNNRQGGANQILIQNTEIAQLPEMVEIPIENYFSVLSTVSDSEQNNIPEIIIQESIEIRENDNIESENIEIESVENNIENIVINEIEIEVNNFDNIDIIRSEISNIDDNLIIAENVDNTVIENMAEEDEVSINENEVNEENIISILTDTSPLSLAVSDIETEIETEISNGNVIENSENNRNLNENLGENILEGESITQHFQNLFLENFNSESGNGIMEGNRFQVMFSRFLSSFENLHDSDCVLFN